MYWALLNSISLNTDVSAGWHPVHSCDSQRGWENGGGLASHTMGREKNSDLTQDSSHSVWDSHSLAPVFRCHSLRLSPEFMFFNLHPLTHLVPFSKNRFLGSPTKCVSKCSLWTGSKNMAWEFAGKAQHTFEPHPQHTVSQTLERGPGICGSLNPKGKRLQFQLQ